MKKSFFWKGLIFIFCYGLFFSTLLVFAADNVAVKIQGVVMELDVKKNTMIVNEMKFIWDANTIINNEKGLSMAPDKIITKSWVYIEGTEDRANKRIIAKKISLLPK